eukprot:621296-Pleurochrysis_carterae.AAC.1
MVQPRRPHAAARLTVVAFRTCIAQDVSEALKDFASVRERNPAASRQQYMQQLALGAASRAARTHG